MSGVNVPGSTDFSGLKTIVPMVGGMVGTYFGGPAGGAAGSKLGAMLSKKSGTDPGAVQEDVKGGGTPDAGAVDRRISSLEDNPSMQLAQADAALQQMPPEIQQQYGPTIAKARQMDAQGGS